MEYDRATLEWLEKTKKMFGRAIVDAPNPRFRVSTEIDTSARPVFPSVAEMQRIDRESTLNWRMLTSDTEHARISKISEWFKRTHEVEGDKIQEITYSRCHRNFEDFLRVEIHYAFSIKKIEMTYETIEHILRDELG